MKEYYTLCSAYDRCHQINHEEVLTPICLDDFVGQKACLEGKTLGRNRSCIVWSSVL